MTERAFTVALPVIADARLPLNYDAARKAIQACAKVDECKDWADKAAALASYAKQADDDQLLKQCMRIKARATYRCGELLEEIEAGKGGRPKTNAGADISLGPDVGADTRLTRKRAAEDAGMSPRQAVTAIRVAHVPPDSFERQVESDTPPTITELASQGMRKRQESEEAEAERLKKGATETVATLVDRLNPRNATPEQYVKQAFGRAEPKYWPPKTSAPLNHATLIACAQVMAALADAWKE